MSGTRGTAGAPRPDTSEATAGMTPSHPFFVAGKPAYGTERFSVTHPPDGSPVADVSVPDAEQLEASVSAAHGVQQELAELSALARGRALDQIAAQLARRRREVAELITSENGKPIRWAGAEVQRTITTFRIAAEEARRFSGDLMRLDTQEGSEGRMAVVRRFPRGPVLAIAPFNFPLNLVAHKVAPAIAVGAPVIIKPAPATPLTALLLGELLAETDLPSGAWSVLTATNEQMPRLVEDPRVPVISFTGSAEVGWRIQDSVPRKHVTLELGGNAAAIVCADYCSEEDLDHAAERIAQFAMYQAGQSCISVQQVLAHSSLYEELCVRVTRAVGRQAVGDVWDDRTAVGPLIDEAAAERVETWVGEATSLGARVLTGGRRRGSTYEPTVLVDVSDSARIAVEEVFGPVVNMYSVDDVEEAFDRVNASRYGLQTGVFTHDLRVAFAAHRRLQVGGVIVGDVPSYRADQMPYGGVKDSGNTREGPAYAVRELTEERLVSFQG
jgi:acyl-CoA reductase-like NAD-dependent aldehyde dehydrogenase